MTADNQVAEPSISYLYGHDCDRWCDLLLANLYYHHEVETKASKGPLVAYTYKSMIFLQQHDDKNGSIYCLYHHSNAYDATAHLSW